MTLPVYATLPITVRLALVFLGGAIGALGQAPYDQPLALVLSLTAGCFFWRRETAHSWLVGWLFGSGYFAVALLWIVEPFQVDVARHGWMAPFALVFLSAGLALFWAAAFWAARRLSSGAIGLVVCWTGAEMLRAYVFTGFPWASPAQIAVEGPISATLAWTGPHGVTLLLIGLAAVLSSPVSAARAAPAMSVLGKAILILAAALAFLLPDPRAPSATTDHWVRVVQPNAEQHLKWRPDMAEEFYRRLLAATAASPGQGHPRPDLVVWPETAIPWLLEDAGPILSQISQAAASEPVVLGALRSENGNLRNALALIEAGGTVKSVYDKHHLVPFGEYMPFARLAEYFGLHGLAATMGGFDRGEGAKLLDFDEIGRALPLICYEAVFAHGVNAMPGRADFLLHITNDAWFGQFAGPQQHLAQARMRAIEQGLPVVRAANTGISAIIDPLGRITAHLPLGEVGFVDAALPVAMPATFYSRLGDWPVLLILLSGLLGLFVKRRLIETRLTN